MTTRSCSLETAFNDFIGKTRLLHFYFFLSTRSPLAMLSKLFSRRQILFGRHGDYPDKLFLENFRGLNGYPKWTNYSTSASSVTPPTYFPVTRWNILCQLLATNLSPESLTAVRNFQKDFSAQLENDKSSEFYSLLSDLHAKNLSPDGHQKRSVSFLEAYSNLCHTYMTRFANIFSSNITESTGALSIDTSTTVSQHFTLSPDQCEILNQYMNDKIPCFNLNHGSILALLFAAIDTNNYSFVKSIFGNHLKDAAAVQQLTSSLQEKLILAADKNQDIQLIENFVASLIAANVPLNSVLLNAYLSAVLSAAERDFEQLNKNILIERSSKLKPHRIERTLKMMAPQVYRELKSDVLPTFGDALTKIVAVIVSWLESLSVLSCGLVSGVVRLPFASSLLIVFFGGGREKLDKTSRKIPNQSRRINIMVDPFSWTPKGAFMPRPPVVDTG